MEFRGYSLGSGNIGWFIALIVFVLCICAWFFGKSLSSGEVLGLIGALALSRLL